MADQKEAYLYQNYIQNLDGAKVKVLYSPSYTKPYHSVQYTRPGYVAEAFIKETRNPQIKADFDDFFGQRVEQSQDRIALILGELKSRSQLNYENLNRLYDDLFRIDNWRTEIPFPDNYLKGRTWESFNQMELQIRDQIRRELKDFAKDTAFPTKDLRESLLEFKLQSQKSKMMDLGSLDEMIEPAGSYNNTERDMHYIQNQP